MTVSIQGVKGAFHEEAAIKHFCSGVEIMPGLNFQDVIEAILEDRADKGMMAVENTISGTLHDNLRLICESGLQEIVENKLNYTRFLVLQKGKREDSYNQKHTPS